MSGYIFLIQDADADFRGHDRRCWRAIITQPGASNVANKIDRRLAEQPRHYRIRDRDFVNIAPVELW